MLDVPTDRDGYVDKALLVLHDFASGVLLLPEEVDKERGVVLEEWRGRLGAGSRITDKQLPVLLQGSRYAERLPIGTARGDQGCAARAVDGVLPEVVPAGPDGRGGGRRSRSGRGREAVARTVRQHPTPLRAGRGRGPHRPLARRDALQRGHRSGVTGLDRDARFQEQTGGAADRCATTAPPSCGSWWARCSTRASARSRAVPTRHSWRPKPAPTRSGAPCSCSRLARPCPRTAWLPASRRSCWRRERVQQFGFSAAELDRARRALVAGLRTCLQRARDQREPELRRRVRPALPRRRAHSGHRARVPHRVHLSADGDAGGSVARRA